MPVASFSVTINIKKEQEGEDRARMIYVPRKRVTETLKDDVRKVFHSNLPP